ncbi:hypothetical protein MSKOL_2027 [Methanosarcina sp. Kolksee]|uniref:hypothetical protein n=1 Tax=Methanosarcina sp. Kolksee TaxID=1434099 RepID=UPI0006160E65|nr:hypothetical protein [Methanosarcina sp. Kolksee]AKB47804.1 hypothetical protein MSKOL_2027 [Methanosarcina sp. Kolksee]
MTLKHEKIEDIQKVKEFLCMKEYKGLSVEISPEDEVFSMPDKLNWCSLFREDWECGKGCYYYNSLK